MNKITFIKKIQESKEIYTFEFSLDNNIEWVAGQFSVFSFTHDKVEGKKDRAFSIVSIVEENKIIFSTKIVASPSSFKKYLLELKVGDKMNMKKPMGKFILNNNEQPLVLIAGGIGITPIRSLIKDIEMNNKKFSYIKIIYSSMEDECTFKEYLDYVDKRIEFVAVDYVCGIQETADLIDSAVNEYKNDALYYISGSPGMINGIKGNIIKKGVKESNIKFDAFIGY